MRYWREVLMGVLAAMVVFLLVTRPRQGAKPLKMTQAGADSMRMARSFDSLGYVIFDLSNELHSRTAEVVLQEALPPRATPEGRVVQPVPVIPPIPRPTPTQLATAARATPRNAGRGVIFVFQNEDVRSSGVEEWFRTQGAQLRPRLPLGDRKTNTLVYGDSVPWEFVRLTALQLASEGVALKRVRRARTSAEPRVIRLENLTHLDDATPLSAEQVLRLSPAPPSR
ncbi:MAG TPA: hypothetical protein VK358_04665 [Longimicrobium sp.]|jgi:hypothetical protein|nr:hypothetical protein [Longimicrobium sp.]